MAVVSVGGVHGWINVTRTSGGVALQPGQRDLYLAGLLPMTGVWPGGRAMLTSAEMALVRVNERPDVLPGYRLNLVYGNTKVRSLSASRLLSVVENTSISLGS